MEVVIRCSSWFDWVLSSVQLLIVRLCIEGSKLSVLILLLVSEVIKVGNIIGERVQSRRQIEP